MHTPAARHGFDVEEMHASASPIADEQVFYRSAVDVLQSAGIDFLVGGAYAMRIHAGVERDTKDFDLFIKPGDADRVIEAFRDAGFCAGYAYSHWLLKVHGEGRFLDIIFRAGNGLCDVDEGWFTSATEAEFFGAKLRVCPPEEMIWQKTFIMERERYDGADVQHLLQRCGRTMDWERLLQRFGEDWLVLLSHLVLFRYAFPSDHDAVPPAVIERLTTKLLRSEAAPQAVCRGTLLSRLQYLDDVERWGYADARSAPRVRITEDELSLWTQEAREQALLAAEKSMHTNAG
jgi:hypothetical protein